MLALSRQAQLWFHVCIHSGAIALGAYAFGPGNGTIFLDNLACTGEEEFLYQCRKPELGIHNCNHEEDAAVLCRNHAQICANHSVRLVNGTEGRTYEGRVEVCINNHWGTVCDQSWDSKDADTICRQLGYPGTVSMEFRYIP